MRERGGAVAGPDAGGLRVVRGLDGIRIVGVGVLDVARRRDREHVRARCLEDRERTTRVARGEPPERVAGFGQQRHAAAESTGVGDGPIEQHAEVLVGERLQGEQE